MNRKYWDLASGAGVLALAVALFVGSTKVKTLDVSRFGSGFFPAVVALLLAAAGIVILVGGIGKARGPAEPAPAEKPRSWAVFATFVLMAAYAALLPAIGFLITTTLYLFVQMSLLAPAEKRRPLLFGLVSVAASLIVYYTFVKVFQLMLPAGILG